MALGRGVSQGLDMGRWLSLVARAGSGRDAAHLQLLHTVVRLMSEADGPKRAAPALLAAIGTSLEAERANLWTAVEPASLRCSESWHAAALDAGRYRRVTPELTLRPGFGLPGLVLERGGPVWLASMGEDATFPRGQGLGDEPPGGMAFPARSWTGIAAVVELIGRDVRRPDTALLEC